MFDRFYVGTTPTVMGTIVDSDGVPIDLTGSTVTLLYRPAGAATPVVTLAAVYDPDQVNNTGRVKLQLSSPLMASPGRWEAWWHALLADNTVFESDAEALVIANHDPVIEDPGVGPCTEWIDADDIAALPAALPDVDYSAYAILASELLYMWSGRQFPGNCTRTVRPARQGCSCWGSMGGIFQPPWLSWNLFAGTWGWAGRANETPPPDGCGCLSRVRLPGYARAVIAVTINGDTIDPSWYRLDWNRDLVALFDDNGNPFYWPWCQDMRLGPLDPGAFTVTYTWGHVVPQAGKVAAAALALQLYNADHGGTCVLPAAVTRMTRQGVTLEKRPDATNVASVDAFLAAYNPTRKRRSAAVWSPDLPRSPRRTS